MTLEAIKEAIQHLPENERCQLAGWFDAMEETAWDEYMRRDFAPGGKGERLAKQIQQEISRGTARPLEEGLAKRRRRPQSSPEIRVDGQS
jgi:hypothetical protein